MPDLRVIGFDWKEGACGQDHLGLGWGLGLGNLSGDLGAGWPPTDNDTPGNPTGKPPFCETIHSKSTDPCFAQAFALLGLKDMTAEN